MLCHLVLQQCACARPTVTTEVSKPCMEEFEAAVHQTLAVCLYAVLDGMDLVKKIESEGTGSGKPKKQVTIAKSGELAKKSWV